MCDSFRTMLLLTCFDRFVLDFNVGYTCRSTLVQRYMCFNIYIRNQIYSDKAPKDRCKYIILID